MSISPRQFWCPCREWVFWVNLGSHKHLTFNSRIPFGSIHVNRLSLDLISGLGMWGSYPCHAIVIFFRWRSRLIFVLIRVEDFFPFILSGKVMDQTGLYTSVEKYSTASSLLYWWLVRTLWWFIIFWHTGSLVTPPFFKLFPQVTLVYGWPVCNSSQ